MWLYSWNVQSRFIALLLHPGSASDSSHVLEFVTHKLGCDRRHSSIKATPRQNKTTISVCKLPTCPVNNRFRWDPLRLRILEVSLSFSRPPSLSLNSTLWLSQIFLFEFLFLGWRFSFPSSSDWWRIYLCTYMQPFEYYNRRILEYGLCQLSPRRGGHSSSLASSSTLPTSRARFTQQSNTAVVARPIYL